LHCACVRRKRSRWSCRADSTRSRIDEDGSPATVAVISSGASAGTSICRSIRSSSGPEIFARYREICSGEQTHSCRASL
jgi:hypothetical protein